MKVELDISHAKRILARRFDSGLFVTLMPYMSNYEIEVWRVIIANNEINRKVGIVKLFYTGVISSKLFIDRPLYEPTTVENRFCSLVSAKRLAEEFFTYKGDES